MTREDEIGYSGPSREIVAPQGGSRPKVDFAFLTPKQQSYADINLLRSKLTELTTYLTTFTTRLEGDLRNYAMIVSPSDLRLRQAIEEEWPKTLGAVEDRVSYRYYKVLKGRTTTASDYITQKFEEASRDITGNDALDILFLAQSSLDETHLVVEFLDTFINDIDDPSEYRILELFQDWAQSALRHAGNIGSIYTAGEQGGVPLSELDQIGPTAARDAQAVLKIKMNELSVNWSKEHDSFQKNYSQYAATFYGRYLGPALRFRLSIGRKFLHSSGDLGADITATVDSTNSTLQQMLTDQMRRNTLYDEKLNSMSGMLTTRSQTREVVQQLAAKSAPTVKSSSGNFVPVQESIQVIDRFENEIFEQTSISDPVSSFKSQHAMLTGTNELDAHSQYLLLAGGTLTGDLALALNVKVDGIIPHTHNHSGSDGSATVAGQNIQPGSLTSAAIDTTTLPPAPTALRLSETELRIVPPGVTVVDATVSWIADASLQFEVQFTPLPAVLET